ncbi:protein FAR1-RELATED SEQUENCE 5-like [Helianthus annuus]|uniref:protein FAR1-RELATED SEQUENCE 5-like n=1 Tax=Helianthus annuus TaxID=4232 RepID=UPI000B8F1DA9|nr:protein FAR1-RELATED SEQUENCE 5-like [Helianthus annuus]
MAKLNMGPVKAFSIMKTIFSGFEKVGSNKVDFKNYKRQINLFIGEYDAKMVVRYLHEKKQSQPNFSYNYFTDDDYRLKGLFWCDDQCKLLVAFSGLTIYVLLFFVFKYSMVFVPSTCIDNHHCVGDQPKVVLTDQDPTMKKTISVVGIRLYNSTDFKECICGVVWMDILTPEEFESCCEKVMEEFNIVDNDWLSDIFALRESWILTYYRIEFLLGHMRTTSRFESENHFFGQICNAKSTLVEFMAHYETAIEAQCHKHRKNDHESRYKCSELKSNYRVLESQASKIYTKKKISRYTN